MLREDNNNYARERGAVTTIMKGGRKWEGENYNYEGVTTIMRGEKEEGGGGTIIMRGRRKGDKNYEMGEEGERK